MDIPQPPIVIRESRWKAAMLVIAAVFLVLGALIASRSPKPSTAAIGYFGMVFFGAGGLISTVQVFRPSTLTLGPHGFTVDQLFRSWTVRWDQASNFSIGSSGRGFTRYVTYDYKPDRLAWGGLNRWGQLPLNWTMSPPKLAELMEQCKDRWDNGKSPTREPTVAQPLRPEAPRREPTVS